VQETQKIDDEEAKRLHAQDLSVAAIAHRTGFSESTVWRALKRAGVDFGPERTVDTVRHGRRLYSTWVRLRHRARTRRIPNTPGMAARALPSARISSRSR
jgi:IS30 family transposase